MTSNCMIEDREVIDRLARLETKLDTLKHDVEEIKAQRRQMFWSWPSWIAAVIAIASALISWSKPQ